MIRIPIALLALVAACGGDDVELVALFPVDYEATYIPVRDCRTSADHDLSRIRVLTDEAALNPYVGRNALFPAGSIVLKEEYDFADAACEGPVLRWSVLQRLPDGGPADHLGWRWQRVEQDRTVSSQDEARCFGCHVTCSTPPDGYQGTCAVP